jgi:hypothetical protein
MSLSGSKTQSPRPATRAVLVNVRLSKTLVAVLPEKDAARYYELWVFKRSDSIYHNFIFQMPSNCRIWPG